MENVRDEPDELDLLRQSLALCQQELARARSTEEAVREELAHERMLRLEIDKQGDRLAGVVQELLLEPPAGTGLVARVRRRVRRKRLARPQEWQEADVVAGSSLFSSDWYIRRYPDVLQSGLPPALHYVRHGARQGKNPSEQFNTARYVEAHPELRKSGVNPLVHHLTTDRVRPRDR